MATIARVVQIEASLGAYLGAIAGGMALGTMPGLIGPLMAAATYLALSPDRKIPVILDHAEGRAILESGVTLWHLATKYGRFLPADPTVRSEVMQWMFFQVGHIGPIMGQAMYFQNIAAPNGHEEPFSIRRYADESRRLLEVIDRRLQDRDWTIPSANPQLWDETADASAFVRENAARFASDVKGR